jgi:5-hydroxyisourate hydrolase-like protein (transthyretin family)
LKMPWIKRTTTTKLSVSGKTLTGKVVDTVTGKTIAGMKVTIYYRRAGSTTWKKITTRTTGASGTFTYKVSPPKSTYYRLKSSSTATWAYDRSPSKKITI